MLIHFKKHLRTLNTRLSLFVVTTAASFLLPDDDIIRQTGLRPCLELVIQSRLRRDGFIILPSDVTNGVQRVTNEAQALELIEKFIKGRRRIHFE